MIEVGNSHFYPQKKKEQRKIFAGWSSDIFRDLLSIFVGTSKSQPNPIKPNRIHSIYIFD
jgi:hypothetical protein